MIGKPSPEPVREVSGSHSIFRLPQRLGRYTLTKRLGAGGMAEVFLAQQDGAAGFQKQCVVKRILPHLAEEPRFVAMFQREARIAALLSHTNIAQITELSEVDGVYFIAMEYVDGAPLNRLARAAWRAKRSLPLEVASCAVADAALGLQAAHEQKDTDGKPLHLVHRDISPDNLIINREGVTKILDFGVAKSALFGDRTATGELKGKIPFLSPEQIRGDDVDGRADLYALGVTFYWLLTGKRPLNAPTDLALVQVVLTEMPKPPREINPSIPEAIDDLIMRLLAKDREQRPKSGGEVFDLLAAATSTRRTLVAPFVNEVLELPDERNDDPVALDAGFIPSTPFSDVRFEHVLTSPGRARGKLESQEPTGDMLDPISAVVGRKRAPIVVGAAAALLVGVAALAFVVYPGSPKIVASVDAGAPPVDVKPPDKPPAPVVEKHDDVPPPTPAIPATPGTPATTTKTHASKGHNEGKLDKGDLRDVSVKAPPAISWESEGGKPLGNGTTTLKVPSSSKFIVAYDFRRAVRTKIPVSSSTIDYGALPHGKIDPRANPYADVFVGITALGTTPIAALDTVVGTYVVRFSYEGREEKRTIDVKPGEVTRVTIDFAH